MNTLSQYEISRKIRRAYQASIVLAVLFGLPSMIDFFRGEGELWMIVPVFYALIILGCAYAIYRRKIIAGIFACVSIPFWYFFFMKHSYTFAVVIALYLLVDGTYAIYKFHQNQKTVARISDNS